MKIDVGSGGYGYSGPAYHARREAADGESVEDSARNHRNALNISRTPISPSLANALWAVERGRVSGKNASSTAEESPNGPNGGVLDRYLEFAVSGTEEYH